MAMDFVAALAAASNAIIIYMRQLERVKSFCRGSPPLIISLGNLQFALEIDANVHASTLQMLMDLAINKLLLSMSGLWI